MDNRILEFLGKHEVGSLTTLLPDGSPHAAALHFSHSASPLELYFLTKNTTRKIEGLLNGEKVRSSFVAGFSDEESITLQMDGEVIALPQGSVPGDNEELFYTKHPKSNKYRGDPAYIFLKFTLSWWQYTDYNTKPTTILSSDSK